MRAVFASAVDPIFEYTIDLLHRIESGMECDPITEHSNLIAQLDRTSMILGSDEQWELARYAVVSWIDEMLLSIPWNGVGWWKNHILEMELFHSRICHVRFFELAREATKFRSRDALEVFYNCVLLGFRGMYADSNLTITETDLTRYPATIEQWSNATLKMIQLANSIPFDEGRYRVIRGASPHYDSTRLIWWSVAATLLAIANGATYLLSHR